MSVVRAGVRAHCDHLLLLASRRRLPVVVDLLLLLSLEERSFLRLVTLAVVIWRVCFRFGQVLWWCRLPTRAGQ